MRFFMQMGHGMMAMNRELLGNFASGTDSGVIIWPRTLEPDQIVRHSQEVRDLGASLLYDSCFYLPYTNRPKILSPPYWDGVDFSTTDFTGQQGIDFCLRVIDYQIETLHVTELLLPGRYTNVRNDDWLQMHGNFSAAVANLGLDIPLYATIALGPDLISDIASFDAVINEVVNYPVSGVYFVYHPPRAAYICNDDLFLNNLLSALLSLSIAGKNVILGYANQQDLFFAAAGVETIATGNFRNVRSFDPSIFDEEEENDRQRAIWYYDGQSLCEFRLQQLGLAYQRLGMRGIFGPESQYSQDMLRSPNPANVRWPEPNAFKHYISVLRDQWLSFERLRRSDRHEGVRQLLLSASQHITSYQNQGMQIVDRAADTVGAFPAWLSAMGSFIASEAPRIANL